MVLLDCNIIRNCKNTLKILEKSIKTQNVQIMHKARVMGFFKVTFSE
jgi:hypothetical protein